MSTEIERLRYYERQYLQSSDFTDEQTYHLEMRRRLNLALHLWGIVKGLELLYGEVIQGTPDQYYVSEGMAIDAYGREIIVPAKHLLSGDLETNQITAAGTYSVWIGYTRELTTPPQAGYQRCDATNQYTRWQESFEIILTSVTANPNPTEDPDPFGDLPDDPTKYPWLIHLGTINLDKKLTITAATNADRVYIGIRTQRIVAPHRAIDEYNVLDANAPLDPLTSIKVRDNFFLEQNLIAGTDFAVDPQKIQPTPVASPPNTFPNPTGNVKIASDVFLQGNLYTHCDPTQPDLWLNLDQCIRERIVNSIPEIQIGSAPLKLSSQSFLDSSGAISATAAIPITTQLAQVDRMTITTSIGSLHWLPEQPVVVSSPPSSPPTSPPPSPSIFFGTHPLAPHPHAAKPPDPGTLATSPPANTDGLQIDTCGQVSLVSGNNYTATVKCSVAPAYRIPSSGTTLYQVPIDFVAISYVVIFYPPTS
jgi:hypothetical protein